MYEAFWKLDEKPFENTWDDRYFYPSEVHQGAMLKLRYVIENRRPAALLTGAAGLGKSLLAQRLLTQLDAEFSPQLQLVYPQMPHDQLLAYLANTLRSTPLNEPTPTIEQSVRTIEDSLQENVEQGRHAIVLIDEAHLVRDAASLESLRLLLNFRVRAGPALTLLLVGQPAILPLLNHFPSLEEQLAVKCLMRPLSEEETVSYVVHRVTAAGAERPMFDNEALGAIHHLSEGIPRRINRLCDLALLIAFAEEQPLITYEHVDVVSNELVTVQPE